MILTCPDCATRYFLDDERFGTAARTVRCAACGNSWKASREDEASTFTPQPMPAASPAASPTPKAPAAAAKADEPLPKAFRAKVQARKQTRRAAAAGVVWGGLGAMVAALMLGAVLFRVDVVRLWPRTAGAYAKVGLPVNPVGLSPENVQAAPGLKDGHVAVNVTGALRNVETRPRKTTALKISLLDKAGKQIASTIVHPEAHEIAPGKTAPFAASFLDPPSAAVNVQVEFVFQTAKATELRGRHDADHDAHEAPVLRGQHDPDLPPPPHAKTAEPLPAESPYALPADDHAPDAGHAPTAAHGDDHHG